MHLGSAGRRLLGCEQQTGLISALVIISKPADPVASADSSTREVLKIAGGYTAFSAFSVHKSDGKHSVPCYSTLSHQSGRGENINEQ